MCLGKVEEEMVVATVILHSPDGRKWCKQRRESLWLLRQLEESYKQKLVETKCLEAEEVK